MNFLTLNTLNSYEQENKHIPRNNNYHFRDSSADSDSDSSPSTSPTSTPTSPIAQSNDTTLNNNNTPNLQRRASESGTEIQFKRLPARRYTLPGKFGLAPLSRFWEAGRGDSSVQVAMDNVQFGL
jgi:hypothetical protein